MTAPSTPAPTRRWTPLLRLWWKVDRGTFLRTLALGLALVSLVLLWPSLIRVGGAGLVLNNMLVHLYVAAWLMLASLGVRSVGGRDVVTGFLLGMFLVPLAVFVPLTPVVNRLGSRSSALATWWVPPVEEGAILAAIALVAWRLCRRIGRRPGVLDLTVVGWAVGSGYAIHEDALYGRFLPSFPHASLWGAFEGPYALLFPTFTTSATTGGLSTYHGGSGTIYGMVLGLVLVLHRRAALVRWLVPLTWLYLTVDHGLYNHQLWHGPSALRFLFGNGHAQGLLLVLGVPALLVFEHWRRRRVDLDLPAFGWAGVREAVRRSRGTLDAVVRLLAYGQYHRNRNAAFTAAWRRPDQPPPDVRGVEAWGRIAFAPPH